MDIAYKEVGFTAFSAGAGRFLSVRFGSNDSGTPVLPGTEVLRCFGAKATPKKMWVMSRALAWAKFRQPFEPGLGGLSPSTKEDI